MIQKKQYTSNTIAIGLSIILFALIIIKNGWMGDDAFITLRTIDNFVNGHGLRWNIIERVQTFTHPLWLFLITPFYFFTREPYFTTLFISLFCSIAAIILLGLKITDNKKNSCIAILILTTSKAFVDYSMSGLENPLTYLLIVLFCIIFFQQKKTHIWLLKLSFILGLSMLNRLDTTVLYIPGLIYAFYITPQKKLGTLHILIGMIPIIFWEIFSLIYYGYLFPNTAYAKLHTGIPTLPLVKQGFYYFLDSFKRDPVTLGFIAYTAVTAVYKRKKEVTPLLCGVILYLLYIIKIGGGFMSGRFFAAPILLCTIIAIRIWNLNTKKALLICLFLITYNLLNPHSPFQTIKYEQVKELNTHGIADERAFYSQHNGLSRVFAGKKTPNHPARYAGLQIKEQGKSIQYAGTIGIVGYYAGPDIYFVDLLGLGDPLLSRLEVVEKRNMDINSRGWRIGHFFRPAPRGYIESIQSNTNKIENTQIAEYYDRVLHITRGNIFSPKRLLTIAQMNIGAYQHLLNFDTYTDIIDIQAIQHQIPTWNAWSQQSVWWYYGNEIIFNLEHTQHENQIYPILSDENDYKITYLKHNQEIGSHIITRATKPQKTLQEIMIEVPQNIVTTGYDAIKITYLKGPAGYFTGHSKLIK